jgi:hypothetical protein
VQDKLSTDPSELARLVEYVRSQVKHMDQQHILTNGHIQLLPFPPNTNCMIQAIILCICIVPIVISMLEVVTEIISIFMKTYLL